MARARKNKWKDFYDEGLGPNLPLSSDQQKIPVSGLLPSGESNGFDPSQYHGLRPEHTGAQGSGINFPFPYPNTSTAPQYAYVSGEKVQLNKFNDAWWDASGIMKTYPPDDGTLVSSSRESGIFHFNSNNKDTSGIFSNGMAVKSDQIEDFTIFNTYIHHELMPSNATNGDVIRIPYISTYRLSIDWNPYG